MDTSASRILDQTNVANFTFNASLEQIEELTNNLELDKYEGFIP